MAKRRTVITGCRVVLTASLLVLGTALTGCGSDKPGPTTPNQGGSSEDKPPQFETITLKDKAFKLELALDDASREQGLSDRKEIPADGGMLFVFARPVQTQFVMRRCYVPIDLIFVDRKGYIDTLHEMQVIEPIGGPAWNKPLKGYASAGLIQYAIELKGGSIAELGLKRGEKIELPLEALQSKAK